MTGLNLPDCFLYIGAELLWERNTGIMKDKILHTLLRALPMVLVLAVLAGGGGWLHKTDGGQTALDGRQEV